MLKTLSSNPITHWFRQKPRRAVIAFFAILFCIGLMSFRQYGIPYDEGTLDSLARDSYSYVFRGQPWPMGESWTYHGPVVELPLYGLEEWLSPLGSPAENYKRLYVRHFFGAFLFYFFAAFMVYKHGKRFFRSPWWGLFASLLFILLPRIFAHGFYNSRDIPQIALFALAMFNLLRLLDTKTYKRALLLGVTIALAMSLRMSAMILLPITFAFLALESIRNWQRGEKPELMRYIGFFGLTLLVTGICTYVFWPLLWEAPIKNFLDAYHFMSHLGGQGSLLGVPYTTFPWMYVPVWLAVTVPMFIFAMCLTGIGTSTFGILRSVKELSAEGRDRLLYMSWLILPVIAIKLSGAGIFLEWRHIFFISTSIIMLALIGFRDLLYWTEGKKWLHGTVIGLMVLQILATGSWMIRNHPMQFIYYSIPLKVAIPLFLPDYWALSYRQTSQKVMEFAPRAIITLYCDENVGYQNLYTVFPESLARVMRVPTPEEAVLVMTRSEEIAKNLEPLHLIQVDGVTINGVYKGGQY